MCIFKFVSAEKFLIVLFPNTAPYFWMDSILCIPIFLFFRLFDYIQGKNKYGETIEMTGPVMSQISPSDGPFCKSSFVVSFSVPKKNQANPPPAEGLHVQKWQSKFLAVRQFGGFVSDDTIGQQADALLSSLTGSNWASAIDPSEAYAVAQYNSPFEFSGRVNEVWITLDLHASAM